MTDMLQSYLLQLNIYARRQIYSLRPFHYLLQITATQLRVPSTKIRFDQISSTGYHDGDFTSAMNKPFSGPI